MFIVFNRVEENEQGVTCQWKQDSRAFAVRSMNISMWWWSRVTRCEEQKYRNQTSQKKKIHLGNQVSDDSGGKTSRVLRGLRVAGGLPAVPAAVPLLDSEAFDSVLDMIPFRGAGVETETESSLGEAAGETPAVSVGGVATTGSKGASWSFVVFDCDDCFLSGLGRGLEATRDGAMVIILAGPSRGEGNDGGAPSAAVVRGKP